VSDHQGQFGVTTWPRERLPIPGVKRRPSRLDPSCSVILPAVSSAIEIFESSDPAPVSGVGETYLKLGHIDLDNPDAVLEFVNEFGLLGGVFAYHDVKTDARYKRKLHLRKGQQEKRRAVELELRRIQDGRLALLEEAIRGGIEDRLVGLTETLNEFRFAARLLADLTSAWRVVHAIRDPADFEWVSLSRGHEIRNVWDAADLLNSGLSSLLRRFAPHVELSWSGQAAADELALIFEPQGGDRPRMIKRHTPATARLYQICALELFNHIVEGAEYRICKNETCGRAFVRHEGRAKYGQHQTSGLGRYCSKRCSGQQTQRDHRRGARVVRLASRQDEGPEVASEGEGSSRPDAG
jgi:hypothetical protein